MTKKAEEDYPRHKANPGPSKESLEQPNDDKAGRNVPWTIIIAVIVMLIAFYFIFKKNM